LFFSSVLSPFLVFFPFFLSAISVFDAKINYGRSNTPRQGNTNATRSSSIYPRQRAGGSEEEEEVEALAAPPLVACWAC
jgi:hypothetical protein